MIFYFAGLQLPWAINKRQRRPKGQSKMDNPESLVVVGAENTERR